ncbi:MAG: 1-acyl-sn-glycerol-3-phosphate acyltransferase [Spirochaetaceae bacterium]|nr:1-acyl-sn-glycerol-3-phosphate acyltransferase [Spirochaetaceae bacterium]
MGSLRRALITPLLKTALNLICSVDASEYRAFFDRIKKENFKNPFIIALNHINFLEVPMLVTNAHPAPVTGLVQAKAWKNRLMGFLFDSYDAIPINREGSYLQTFRKVHEAIKKGFFVCIAPEGTRSGDGVLRKAKGGIVQLSLITGAPILPIAHFGGQNFWHNIKRFKRTPFKFRIGRPFRFKIQGPPAKEEYPAILEEVMAQIALLLPEELRGEYADSVNKDSRYLEFFDI